MKKKRFSALLAVLFLLTGCSFEDLNKPAPEESLYISEVVSSNELSLYDPFLGARDWFEIYNASDEEINLSGLFVTKNLESAKLYALPDKTVAPGGYVVIFCGGNETEGVLPFGIAKKGETLSLVNRHKELIRSLEVPALIKDISYAMREDGTYGYCALPTPGAQNTGDITDVCPERSLLQVEEEVPVYLPLEIRSVQTSTKQYFCEGCGEFMDLVTLYNPNEEPVSYEGYMLNDKDNPVRKGALPAGTLEPGASVTVFCCGEDCPEKGNHLCIELGLSKNGDSLYLYAPDKTLIESIEIPALEEGATYQRQEDGTFTVTAGIVKRTNEEKTGRPSAEGAYPLDRNASVRLNELLYKNKYSVTDSYGDRSDFAELYNASASPVSLAGWYLSDSPGNLTKWALPSVTLEPGAYFVVFLSGRDEYGEENHASFRVSEGETLYLYNSESNAYDSIPAFPVNANASLGYEDGYVMYGAPTPGAPNGHPWPVTENDA